MYQPYLDIRDRLGEPLWHDENGVPRYVPFEPGLCANIYARFAALLEIRCQSCGALFPVAASWSPMGDRDLAAIEWDADGLNPKPKLGLPSAEHSGYFGYGDAPWHGPDDGRCSGTTMTTEVAAVLEFWRHEKLDWVRDPAHEFRYELEEL